MIQLIIWVLVYMICVLIAYSLNRYNYKKMGAEPAPLIWFIPIINILGIFLLLYIALKESKKDGYLSEKYWTNKWDKKKK